MNAQIAAALRRGILLAGTCVFSPYHKLGLVEEARFRKRVHRLRGEYEDDPGMARFPERDSVHA